MPTDSCQFFYECISCKTLLRPKRGDCCVFCSYGSVKCPPDAERELHLFYRSVTHHSGRHPTRPESVAISPRYLVRAFDPCGRFAVSCHDHRAANRFSNWDHRLTRLSRSASRGEKHCLNIVLTLVHDPSRTGLRACLESGRGVMHLPLGV